MSLSDAELGRWVRSYRKALGLSQGQVADLLDCPRPAVSMIESGQRRLLATEFFTLLAARPRSRGRSHVDSQPVQDPASNDALDDADELVQIISRRLSRPERGKSCLKRN